MVKNWPTMQETWVWFLDQEDSLEKGMAIHSSVLAWEIPWTEELGRLQSMESQRVEHDWRLTLIIFISQERKGTRDLIKISNLCQVTYLVKYTWSILTQTVIFSSQSSEVTKTFADVKIYLYIQTVFSYIKPILV